MKNLILTLLLGSQLLAYDVGDTVSPEMVKHLSLEGNRVYVIDFFASWCGSCQKEIPLIAKANLSINPKEVEIIGIDVDKKPENAAAFQKELKEKGSLNFRVINDSQNIVISAFNPIGMPTLYYVKDQKVVKIITGAVDNIDVQVHRDLKTMR